MEISLHFIEFQKFKACSQAFSLWNHYLHGRLWGSSLFINRKKDVCLQGLGLFCHHVLKTRIHRDKFENKCSCLIPLWIIFCGLFRELFHSKASFISYLKHIFGLPFLYSSVVSLKCKSILISLIRISWNKFAKNAVCSSIKVIFFLFIKVDCFVGCKSDLILGQN